MVEVKNKPPLDSETSVKETLKSLSRKNKIQFIYDYYKFPIIAGILSIIIISYISYSIATKQNTYCNITYYGSNINTDNFNKLKDILNKSILSNNKKYAIFTNSLLVDSNSNYGDDPTTTQAFAVKLAANEIDILLVEKNNFEYFAANNMLLDLTLLDGFYDLNISEDSLITSTDQSGNNNLYGIKVDNLNLLKDCGFNNENTFLCIAISSNRHEQIINVLNELIK
ncbi:hypothetical protein [uncultured Clostridium sp.]|uniref:hypothetical protein n=1 Tax=uncultured Clostridium sp. TaxID=59620 RepID=UPI0025D20B9C|nr:hypothetical protein [uncultured Clostridium sp.]